MSGSADMYSGIRTFAKLDYSSDFNNKDAVIYGMPFDLFVSNRPGSRFGPTSVRSASNMICWERPYGLDFDPLEALSVVDAGDVDYDYGKPETFHDNLRSLIEKIYKAGATPIGIGGDHSCSFYPLEVLHKLTGKPISLLQFDAHGDTWEDKDYTRTDHGTMFYKAAKQGIIDPAHSVQLGLRTHNDDTLGFNIFDAPHVHEVGIQEVMKKTLSILGDRPVYLSFDIDCLDPSMAPGTGTPVCGGLFTHQIYTAMRKLRGINLIGADMVEVAPAYDHSDITSVAGATIVLDILSLLKK